MGQHLFRAKTQRRNVLILQSQCSLLTAHRNILAQRRRDAVSLLTIHDSRFSIHCSWFDLLSLNHVLYFDFAQHGAAHCSLLTKAKLLPLTSILVNNRAAFGKLLEGKEVWIIKRFGFEIFILICTCANTAQVPPITPLFKGDF